MPLCCTRRFWRRAEKAEEVDDSSGSFGQFAAGVIWGWIAARQASGSDPAQTCGRGRAGHSKPVERGPAHALRRAEQCGCIRRTHSADRSHRAGLPRDRQDACWHRRADEALAWVERGIALERQNSQWSWAGGDLKKLQRELLASLGRGREALESAWTEFQARPSKYAYDDLVERVPGADRPAWKEKARSSWSGRANSGATPAMPISPAKSSPRGSTWRR